NCLRVWYSFRRLQKREHLFVDVIAVSDGFSHRRARFCPAFRTLDSLAESLVVRVEVKKKILGINAITRLVSLQHCFKEPRCVADVPAWRAHEISRLNYVVFDFE